MASACAESLSERKELPPDRGLRLGPCEPAGASLVHHHPAGPLGLPISLLSSLSCRHRRGHVPADLQTEHFVFLQRANPATWRSAFCLPVTQPACPILCRHGSSFSCHLHRKRTDKHSVPDWGQLAGSCLPHSAPSPLLSLGSKHCLSSVEGHRLARKGNCAACHPAPALWGCALCIVHLQNTPVLLLQIVGVVTLNMPAFFTFF